ncbi:hypothetical protein TNCV_1622051 [Trichonephila clavipes]|nr:hypothetical protein TNCV_1622051 [Trichonephila clavipes]
MSVRDLVTAVGVGKSNVSRILRTLQDSGTSSPKRKGKCGGKRVELRDYYNVAQFKYTRVFGNGPRNFEPWSRDEDDTSVGTPLLTTTTHQREDVSALDRFNVHRSTTRWDLSGIWLELVTC